MCFLKRILVVSENDLLLTGIERLLGANNGYSIHKSVSLDEKDIIQQIQQTGMDVIIIEANEIVPSVDRLIRLMCTSNQLRVLTLEVNSNQIQIYDKREVLLQGSEDLVSYL
jgi:DNA-binding NarL/FixJ family response regulator